MLATVGGLAARRGDRRRNQPAIRDALAGRESFEPAAAARRDAAAGHRAGRRSASTHPEILGTLSVGFLLDDALAAQLKRITGSDIAFGMDGQILAATLPARSTGARRPAAQRRAARRQLGAEEYVALPRPLARRTTAPRPRSAVALILRSRTEQLRFLQAIHTGLRVTAVVAVLLATVLSFAVARTITRPLAAITASCAKWPPPAT